MKVCEVCEIEISTPDGENRCRECSEIGERKKAQRKEAGARARANRAAMREAMDSLGMKRVRGAMGGVYYE